METKKAEVVMLPTEDRTEVYVNKYITLFHEQNNICHISNIIKEKTSDIRELEERGYKPQHLYFITDEEIKEGDWFLELTGLGWYKPCQMKAHDLKVKEFIDRCKKIIATTDESLVIDQKDIYEVQSVKMEGSYHKSLPKPSETFLKKYCDAGGIKEVMIEHWLHIKPGFTTTSIKVNSDNIITIYLIKDNSRELRFLNWLAYKDYITDDEDIIFEEWVKINL